MYWGAQLIGASIAGAGHRLLFGLVGDMGATLPSGSPWQSLGLEAVLTFILMFVIMAVATDVRAVGQAAALAIGMTVALGGHIRRACFGSLHESGKVLWAGAGGLGVVEPLDLLDWADGRGGCGRAPVPLAQGPGRRFLRSVGRGRRAGWPVFANLALRDTAA